MAKALYRKYRPKKLAEVVGQEQVTTSLSNALKQGKVSHAYLFIGPRGTGKTSVARIFAHEINEFTYELEDDYVDIIEIDGASNRGIDNIRELREKAAIAPTAGKYKVYIIDEVHMLTKEAFNALLKTLEEPPSHVVFIMATTDAYKVPATIVSRAQTFTFKLADTSVMLDFVKSVANKEKIKIDDAALELVVKHGGGSFRDTLSLLDQISTLSDKEITREMVVSALGLPDDEVLARLLTVCTTSSIEKIANCYKELLISGIKPETLASHLVEYILNNPRPEYLKLLPKLTEVRAPYAEARLLIALTTTAPVAPVKLTEPDTRPIEPVKLVEPPQLKPKPATSSVSAPFDWDNLVNKMLEKNEAIGRQLKKAQYEFDGITLDIYPSTRISESILNSKNNLFVLKRESNLNIVVHSHEEKPKNYKKDAVLSKLSDIMGGEVKNDGGENPF
ncbi:DNA polymerase III subunit gamma/tau [Candidatus Saccharibacteria bacterium]|nr:DNA polymerase III subunit gamma/tau [Candidatus Saccharibacteria bacterium]